MSDDGFRVAGLPGVEDFGAAPGSTVALLGAPGSGKSEALLQLAGRRPTAAVVLLGGRPVRAEEVGLMRQDAQLLPYLTSVENVGLPLIARGTRAERGAIERVLEALRLPPATWYNLAEQLSGGQQQRVALARALIATPALVCLDEPFTELDAATMEAAWSAIRTARTAGAVAVIATNDRDLAARCDLEVAVHSPR